MVHDDRSLNNRFHQLIENGTIDRAYNEQATCAFANIPFTEYTNGLCNEAEKKIYVNRVLNWCPWFILDEILVHEAAHISKGYKYGFDTDSEDSHGPEFEEFNHTFMAWPRQLLTIPIYFISYLFAAVFGIYKVGTKGIWHVLRRINSEFVIVLMGGLLGIVLFTTLAQYSFQNGVWLMGAGAVVVDILMALAIIAEFIEVTSDRNKFFKTSKLYGPGSEI